MRTTRLRRTILRMRSDFPFIDDVKKGERYLWDSLGCSTLFCIFVFWVVVFCIVWTCVYVFMLCMDISYLWHELLVYGIHFICDIHCICVWSIDMYFISIYYMCYLFMPEYLFDICMCWGGASLEVSTQNNCDNYICFVIIKKGEIVGPKAISPDILMITNHI